MHKNATHGHSSRARRSPTYVSWAGMKTRCTNQNHSNFVKYGARGISFDASWADFDQFLADMGERPEGTSLDRIDSDGDYTPSNCRWSTASEQNSNRRGWAR